MANHFQLPQWLQYLVAVTSVFGVIVSLVLTGIAVKLTYKYGESSQQIDTLKSMSRTQQRQMAGVNIE
jgi:hypothetical protein